MSFLEKVMEYEIRTGKQVELVTMSRKYFDKIYNNELNIRHRKQKEGEYTHLFEGIPFKISDDQLEDYVVE